SNASVDPIEQTTASTSGLTYDKSADQYTYVWKTDKGWAGTSRQLVVKLKDGTEQKANFTFTK
ncbi:MAG TPA: PxKF domain-containing protein, partial [Rubrobacteraceae bacterium]|nr:PxKF domain-containing protein [Rubrobacteraceae bacterium]